MSHPTRNVCIGIDPFCVHVSSRLGCPSNQDHIRRITTIYVDESGFMGNDLFNPDQRHLVVASTAIGNEEAEGILRRCFPRYQGAEFKFSNIWRRERHRLGLRSFAEEIPALADRMFVYLVDKRFSLLGSPRRNAAGDMNKWQVAERGQGAWSDRNWVTLAAMSPKPV